MRSAGIRLMPLLFSSVLSFPVLGAGDIVNSPHVVGDSESWRSASVSNGFTVTAVGDLISSQDVFNQINSKSPEIIRLLKSADVTFGNFEGTALDLRKFGGYPEALSGGEWLLSGPTVPKDIALMGFNLMSRANNHATDWGVQGMRSTDRLLDEAGIVHAGTGETLAQARSPRIFNTKNGRVSLVATASRFEANSRAIDPLGEIPGRPGVSTLRTTRYAMVSPNQLDQLRQIRDSQPVGSIRASEIKSDEKNNVVTLLGAKYKASTELKDKIDFSFVMNERDRSGLISSIRQGKQISDFEIVSMHTHEPGNYSELPPDFMQTFAHQAIDNGADMFIGHGPHRLRGIEIYKGRPIFYSLANFIFTENNISPITRDQLEKMGVEPGKMTDAEFKEKIRVEGVFGDKVWYESVIAVNKFSSNGRLMEVKLIPIELDWAASRDADRGIPKVASQVDAEIILKRLQKISQPFGTIINIRDNVGVIEIH